MRYESIRIRPLIVASVALLGALCAFGTVLAADSGAAKKKGKKTPKAFAQQRAANLAIPDVPAAGTSTPVSSSITVPKAFKGKTIADLDLTGLRLTGSAAGAADDISIVITAPSGQTVTIFNQDNNQIGDQSIGPLTLNDDTKTSLCDEPVASDCEDPTQTLAQPFAGTANLFATGGSDTGPLSAFDGTPMRGTWTITAWDRFDVGQTSVLDSWGLRIVPAKPVKSGGSKKAGAAAKKKAKKGPFTGTANPNAAVPDDPAAGTSVPITSTITVPKKFKGQAIGDVNVTGIRTTGSALDAAEDLEFKLTAPNGTTMRLIGAGSLPNDFPSLGPLTLDDDTSTSLCTVNTPPCEGPLESLNAPFAGTGNLLNLGGAGTGPLSSFNGGPMNGAWTLTVWDEIDAGETSVLNSWGLRITPSQPVTAATSKKKKGKSSFSGTSAPNAAIPDDVAAVPSTAVTSTITVPKSFKGKVIGDLDVVGLQTTGVGAGASNDLVFSLTGPRGRTIQLAEDGTFGGASVGPLSLSDETQVSLCTGPPCGDPVESLPPPFAGTSNMREMESRGTAPLSHFDGTPMNGTWTLRVHDEASVGETSTLNSWGLRITAAKPVK